MVTHIDPNRVRYPPEGLVDIDVVGSIGTSPTVIAEYYCDPYVMYFNRIYPVTPSNDLQIVLGVDGRAESMRLNGTATTYETARMQQIAARQSATISVRSTSGTITNLPIEWSMVVRSPTIIEKMRLNMPLSDEEKEIADRLALEDMISLGLVPYQPPLLTGEDVMSRFMHIEEMSYSLGVLSAGASATIGPVINVPLEHVYVLLGVRIGVTSGSSWPVATAGDTFLTINRDMDNEYMRLDLAGMTATRGLIRTYVPFTQRLHMTIDTASGTGSTALFASILVGKRPATVIDHLRWGANLPYGNVSEKRAVEELIAKYTEKGLLEKVKAGVI